jgi:hypothetical protein
VELIAPREDLDLFVRNHADILRGKVLVYKHMEKWNIHHHAIKSNAEPIELAAATA